MNVPRHVSLFFAELDRFGPLPELAKQHGLEPRKFDFIKAGDTSWIYNLVGRLSGWNVTIQVLTDALMAKERRAIVREFIHFDKHGPRDDGWHELGNVSVFGVQQTIEVINSYAETLLIHNFLCLPWPQPIK
jgi:hypothetical protein